MFRIEDDLHAEPQPAEYDSLADALAELRRFALTPYGKPPNLAPCTSWVTCGRCWEVVEYDTSTTPWTTISRESYLEIDAAGARWLREA
ncbi:hypothetical protein [Anaeromyxobacter sp. SG66]|uniref:hypothetical protein n=1 Tax=Anaeromyxobacter sp. SG66 TaxID=2925410 RepID=UPI001F56FE9D|nr:hypothetical protein [Anaeromyxobacter sp. SG66]